MSSSSTESLPKPVFYANEVVCGKWKVLREIGRGGCGVVVSVMSVDENISQSQDSKPPMPLIAAMKAETIDPKGKISQTIKIEAHVLRRLQNSDHFCTLYLACRIDKDTNIMIMSLVGRSMSWLRRHCPSQHFTLSTAVRVGIQCLNAIQEVHRRGFLHRDIKGSNFAIGCEKVDSRIIHLLDFGFARSFLVEDNGELKMRRARKRAPYLGTDRYCSVNVHERGEHGRVDDLWSFLFMVVEFIKGKLPWRNTDRQKLAKAKKFYVNYILENCPSEMWRILSHLQTLNYRSRPDYELIRRSLEEICVRYRFSVTQPFDWERGGDHYARIRKADIKDKQRSLRSLPTQSTPDLTNSVISK